MRVDLLTTGLTALITQANYPSDKITISRFQIGDALDFVYSSSMTTPQGNIWFTGTTANVYYTQFTDEEVSLNCHVDHDDPTGVIGNLVLYVRLRTVEYPFIMVRPNEPDPTVKLKTSIHKAGMNLDVHVTLKIPGLLDRFDFDALTINTIDWLHVDTADAQPAPFSELHDVMVIENHQDTGAAVFAVNSGNQWYGCPLVKRMLDTKFDRISGGETGDSYQYVFNP